MQRHLPHVRKAFVIGEAGLSEELELAGVKTVSYTGGEDGLEPLGSPAAFPGLPAAAAPDPAPDPAPLSRVRYGDGL